MQKDIEIKLSPEHLDHTAVIMAALSAALRIRIWLNVA
jgi:hypothetical protein